MQATFNLATRHYYHRSRLRLFLWLVLVLLIVICGIGGSRLSTDRSETERLLAASRQLDQRLAGHPSGVAEREFIEHQEVVTQLNRNLLRRRTSILTLLNALETSTPPGVSYTLVVQDPKDNSIKLEGMARSMGVLSDLLQRLGSTPLFSKPSLLTSGSSRGGTDPLKSDSQGISFSLVVGWNGP